MVTIKSKKEIELMQDVCKDVALVYQEVEKKIKAGMTTLELDQIVEKKIRELGAVPAQKNYSVGVKGMPNFPSSICVSINDEIIHGIPSKNRVIKEGDLVSIDFVALKNGFHGDAARSYVIGNGSKTAKRLVEVAKQAFFAGIEYAKPGFRIGDISHAIGEFVTSQGFSVLKDFQGHGIGKQMHEDPGIPNYGKAGRGLRLEPGMTLAIEPMIIAGKDKILTLDDMWTIVTEDGSLSAHYENTILITEKEPKILTML